ncbi:glycerol-3-phosphate dehydrogenase [Aurantivibrio infirmus]
MHNTFTSLRDENIAKLSDREFDVLILGGGINGAVSAAALTARGAKVALIDRRDFASGSSSNSSNLAWGGIKYLENGELFLVSKLCRSRNHLMRHYPSSVKEIRFFTTIRRGFRMPAIFVYLGALFYWFIGGCFTKPPRYLSRKTIKSEEPIVEVSDAIGGVEYSDCYLPDNDSRFVFKFIQRALRSGAVIANYVEALGSSYSKGMWETKIRDANSNSEKLGIIRSKSIINACGPYVDTYNQLIGQDTEHRHVFSKGIHLIIDQISPSKKILTFFASDGRLFFMIPMGNKTCIGTTDVRVPEPSSSVTDEGRQFVLDNVNAQLELATPLTLDHIIAERCGVRPLVLAKVDMKEDQDWVKLSRKHVIDSNAKDRFISIFGGKLTDCINVGNEAANLIQDFGLCSAESEDVWYGEPSASLKQEFLTKAREMNLDAQTPSSSLEPLSERFWRRYDERAFELLELIKNDSNALNKPIEEIEYTVCELQLMAKSEMITHLDDFLRRRSKVTQVVASKNVLADSGLVEICQILFGENADQKLQEYKQRST